MLFHSTALSEAHARLAMRHEVNCEDVSAVLYLYEAAMMTLFGSYYVIPPPQPKQLDVNSLPLQVNLDSTTRMVIRTVSLSSLKLGKKYLFHDCP
jgi:DNA replicative helicase MCM subunit Mcm2 (Cdc46/Mcm family)